jgi:hypothetical protein
VGGVATERSLNVHWERVLLLAVAAGPDLSEPEGEAALAGGRATEKPDHAATFTEC